MLQIQHICKEYRTGNLIQKAFDDVSLNLRDNEFVAILHPAWVNCHSLYKVFS